MPDQQTEAIPDAVQITVEDLPPDVARQLREAQRQDPEFLRRLLLYGVTHRTVFETLSRSWMR